MKKHFKIFSIVLIVLACLLGVVLILNFYLKKELEESIGDQLSGSSVEYDKITVSFFKSNTTVTQSKWKIGRYSIHADKILINNLSYIDYLFNKKIVIGGVDVSNPEVIFNKNDSVQDSSIKNKNLHLEKEIVVKKFNVNGGCLILKNNEPVSNKLYFSIKELNFYEILINSRTLKGTLPFEYKSVEIESDSIFYELDEAHNIILKNLKLKNQDLAVKDFRIIPKYNKAEFDRRISVEKDRFELGLNSIKINGLDWAIKNDSLYLLAPVTHISGANFKVYRNKLLPDDISIKPLYSQMIRELGAKIKFDSIFIDSSQVEYEEKVIESGSPGKVGFYNLRAEAVNITNIGLTSNNFRKTRVQFETSFMNEAPLSLNWEFDVRNIEDDFKVSGKLGSISAGAMNSFLKPTLNIVVEGEMESLFFNFQGNKYKASGDMRLKYNNFKVEVLKKDGTGKNKLLSSLANLFVKKEANSKKLEKKGVEAVRDRTKSFWNFLWLFIRNGALKSFL
ncbi:MAG: hypothetical protein MUP24_13760 [Gillisia sp.]|nr:hypothetical protein [Gillisia sp.]